ncbi:MAG: hypothetical protein ACE5JR_08520 [Gemmatimonadota bacterium]
MAGRSAGAGGGGGGSDPLYPELARTERDAELAGEGWTRRFVASPDRLPEVVELYRTLGLEVRVEPFGLEGFREECGDCVLARSLFKVIYTRRPATRGVPRDTGSRETRSPD